MTSPLSTAGLARASARHPWIVVAAWVVIFILAGVAAALGLGDALTTDAESLNDPESVRADELVADRFATPPGVTETVIVRSDTATVDDPAFRQAVERVTATLRALPNVVDDPTRTFNYYEVRGSGDPLVEELVADDRRTTIIPVAIYGNDVQLADYFETVKELNGDGFRVLTAGELSIDEEFNETSGADLQKEILTLPVTLVILIVVFGALVAAGVPIVLALVSIGVAFGLTGIVAQAFQLSVYVVNMITVIGLAVGIDYALFVVERYREERRRGIPKPDAIGLAGGTASKAVFFSGMTVVLALTGMFLIPMTIFRSLGLGAILVTAVAVVATLTLVPALLGLLGDRIDWPRRRRYDAATVAAQAVYDHETIHRGPWGRIARAVMTRPAVSAVLATALLVALALPYVDLKIGMAGVESLPDSDVKTAFQILERDFYAGVIAPVEVVVDAQRTPEVEAGIDRLVAALGQDPAFGPVLERAWNPAGDLARVAVPLKGDANAPEAYAVVERLRDQVVPQAFAGTGAEVLVGGDAAETVDFNQLVDDWTPIVFAFVLGLSFLLLLLAFRSIVVPLKAIVMNLLSVGAAYGLLVLVFQKGYGADFFGFTRTPTIEAWVPIFLFCVLFGLSMDYHVFLLSRIREHFDQTGNNRVAVAIGLQATARIITGAALIMVVVFSAFALGDLVMFQQMGFGLAVSILLDATLVRSFLVPASMALLGNLNWYLPAWLRWLPDLRVEGSPATGAPVSPGATRAD